LPLFTTERHKEESSGIAPPIPDPGGKKTQYPLKRRLDEPHSLPQCFEKEENTLPLPGNKLQIVHSVGI
jgi:hypothetical protein